MTTSIFKIFFGGTGDQVLKQKWVLDLENQAEKIVLESIETRIMSDDSRKNIYKSILVNFERKTGYGKKNTAINMQNWGNVFYFNGCNW